MARLAPLDYEHLNERQQQVHETIVSGPRGDVRGPFAVWLRRPELADTAQALGRYCRFESSLPARLSELAIITTGSFWKAEFEWAIHKEIALKAGIAPDIIEAIRTNKEPVFAHEDERIVYQFSKALHQQHKIEAPLYKEAVDLLGEDGVVDLTGILGYYTLISMTLNVFEVDLPEGMAPQFKERD